MNTFSQRYPLNVRGKWYVHNQCTDCALCREIAPNNFLRNDFQGVSFVGKQPVNEEEIRQCQEAFEGCPCKAIGNDGDSKDWDKIPPYTFPVPEPK